jgi:outer membrane lipoprotein carrier protein
MALRSDARHGYHRNQPSAGRPADKPANDRPARSSVSMAAAGSLVNRLAGTALIALLWLGTATAQAPVGDTTAEALAQSLQRKYDGIRDFTADFVHTYRGGVLRKEVAERGRLFVKRPGKMRWEYVSPEEKLFVTDGVKMYSYLPQDKQVMVQSIPQNGQISMPAMFLSGKGDLSRDFTPSIVPPSKGAASGTLALKLIPRSPQPEYDWLILEVAPQTLDLRGLLTADTQGGQSTFSFTNLKENPGIADKQFVFTIPRGVDVVTDSPSR